MPPRPYVLLSCAVSLDGCLDDATPHRLVLSGPEDLDRVDAERAGCDAILVGAGTIPGSSSAPPPGSGPGSAPGSRRRRPR